MQYKNFSISKKEGKFYLKESKPTEGYVEITYGVNNDKTYHKYFDSVSGIINNVEVKDVDYNGRKLSFLEVSVADGDTLNKISTNLKNKGGYTDEVKALVSSLDGYKVGEPVTITPRKSFSTGKNGKTYENLNIYINYQNIKNDDGKGASTGYINYTDIPAPIKEDDGMGGVEWNWKPQTVFYFNKLNDIMSRFGGNTTTNTTTTQSETKFEPVEQTSFLPDDDSLPF